MTLAPAAPFQGVPGAYALTLRGSGWELKPFLRALFRSEAFYSKRAREGRAKSPVEYTIGLMRSTHLKLRVDYVDYFQTLLGQRPGDPPTVEVIPRDDGSNFKDLRVRVKETRTGMVAVTANVNSDAGVTV